VVNIVGAGSTIITASQLGNSNYFVAADVLQTLNVNQATQIISFASLPSKVITDPPFTLSAVGGASGNAVYIEATRKISAAVSSGSSLVSAMQTTKAFPAMVTQMVAIGEESGALDQMLTKVAEFHEEEVDNAVASLSSLMEPVIMVILGVVIGGLVIAMYLPIFQLGSVV
jgi:hypothetical protein